MKNQNLKNTTIVKYIDFKLYTIKNIIRAGNFERINIFYERNYQFQPLIIISLNNFNGFRLIKTTK